MITVDEIREKFSEAVVNWDDVAPEATELGLFVAKFCFEMLKTAADTNQELAELRERYPDALFQAEDLLRQVKLLEIEVARWKKAHDTKWPGCDDGEDVFEVCAGRDNAVLALREAREQIERLKSQIVFLERV